MSDYLSDEEQLAQLRSWWSSNGKLIVIAVLLAVALVVGWRWYQANRATTIEAASTVYEDFVAAEDDLKPALAAELADVGSGTAYPAMAQLTLASTAQANGDTAAAKVALEAALAASNDSELSDLAGLRLARVEQQLGNSEAALAALAKVRGSGSRGMVAELKGDIHMANGDRALAHEAYVAAFDTVGESERRPVLELKMNTTAGSMSNAVTQTQDADVDTSEREEPTEAADDNG